MIYLFKEKSMVVIERGQNNQETQFHFQVLKQYNMYLDLT